METRIVEVETFKVKGYAMKGPVAEIPGLWDGLNTEIANRGIVAEESFGLCLAMEGQEIYYLAGVEADLAEAFPEEAIVPAGKFIVALAEGGVSAIPTTFNALMAMDSVKMRHSFSFERYIHPAGSNGYDIEVWLPIE
ncbi:GyrI-like domain-containing protein [Sporosarcina sp. FSL K6-1522]|uniref:GyrI-like domain-containing protein n=1 Tax=Sporosarcina sp. FSL K6-1522 TaxID=2921554 RepID=UPI00315A425D